MFEAIEKFSNQFEWQPKMSNRKYYKAAKKFIVLGMGGSHLAADILTHQSNINILVHHNYGLPMLDDKSLKENMIVASSYSGNTEEVIDGLKLALAKKLNVVVLATGGKLIKLAQLHKLPYVQMPDIGIQPRMGLGFQTKALLKLMNANKELAEVSELADTLKPKKYKSQAKSLAKKLKNSVPVIYSSQRNWTLAYNWKIKFNETGKVPAFYNTLPELNHNEMNGFDVVKNTKQLSNNFHFIFLRDAVDHKRIGKRMEVLTKLYRKRKLPVTTIDLKGKNEWHKTFSNLVLADWLCFHLATSYGLEPEPVPMVEEFKKLIK
jgi:glucose/mannose-6-phosphate isomerase